MLSEAGQFWPYVCGTVMAGGRLSCADSTYGEAMRVAMFLRLMDYDAVFGVTEAMLDGLEASGHAAGRRVRAACGCSARIPGAYERLVDAGLAPVHFALCGPAIAIGREPGGPAFVAGAEWELAATTADAERVASPACGHAPSRSFARRSRFGARSCAAA